MVRKAEIKDIPQIMDLLVQVDMVHHNIRPDLFKGPTTKYSATELEAILKDETTPVFVCMDQDEKLLGYAFCIFQQHKDDILLTDIKTLYIDDLCVNENTRGNHVGTKIYDHVVAFAKNSGCYNITLNVWEGNDSAIAFYKKRGLKVQKYGMETIL